METIKRMLGLARDDARSFGGELEAFIELAFFAVILVTVYVGIPAAISLAFTWILVSLGVTGPILPFALLVSLFLSEFVIIYISKLYFRAKQDGVDKE
jgi:hypothetical protein